MADDLVPRDDITSPLSDPVPFDREFRKVIIPSDAKGDFETARTNVHEMLTRNADALQELLQVAACAPHPRTFEVIGQLVKSGLDASQTLLDLHKKNQEITNSHGPQVVNNTLVLTSAELLDRIKNP